MFRSSLFINRTTLIYKKLIIRQTSSIKWSYFNKPGEEPLRGETVGQALDKSVQKYENKEAIVFCQNNIRKTYSEFKADVDKFAAGLLAIGLKKEDRIGIYSPNCYEWLVTQFAAAKAGLILVLINPVYQARELEYCLTKVGIRAIVAPETFKTYDYYKILTTIIPSLPNSKPGEIKDRLEMLTHIIMISNKNYGGSFNFSEVSNYGQSLHFKKLKELEKIIQFDDPVNILFTSGTTGSPKAATLTHFNVVNNSYIVGKRLGFNEKVRICLPLPLFHVFGCNAGAVSSVLSGACQIYPAPSYNAEATAKAISEEKCTSMFGTPTMYLDILNMKNIDNYPFTHCKLGVMGGAICSEKILKSCIKKLNMTSISSAFGCTECSPGVAICLLSDSVERKTTTVGTVLEHTEVKIVDPITLHIVPMGVMGELWVRGYLVMQKYWNDKEKTEAAITESRWYRTGDLATLDEDGYLKIVGRLKDMIIRGGENIYPKEIEEFLQTHPKICLVQIVGIPDERYGEEICAWVQLYSGEKLSEKELRDYCKEQLAHFKIPRYIKFVDAFPMTETGKIKKFAIRQQAIDELK